MLHSRASTAVLRYLLRTPSLQRRQSEIYLAPRRYVLSNSIELWNFPGAKATEAPCLCIYFVHASGIKTRFHISLIRTILHHNVRADNETKSDKGACLHLALNKVSPSGYRGTLVESFPAGLLYAETQCGRTPLATYKMMNSSGSIDHEILLKVLRTGLD
jgi:hypothetical protein